MFKKSLIVVMAVLLLPMAAFAGNTNNGTAGSPLELTAAGTGTSLTIAVSPGVFAYYEDDATTTPQWYLIASAHQGGTNVYATAQNSTSIFRQAPNVAPIELTTVTGMTYPTQLEAVSEDYWSDSSWLR